MQFHLFIVLFSAVALVGCQKNQEPYTYTLTLEHILWDAAQLSGEIYLAQGTQEGPFRKWAGAVGNENMSGSFSLTTDGGPQGEVSWPATPGFYYEASGYTNQSGKVYYVVRKIPLPNTQ